VTDFELVPESAVTLPESLVTMPKMALYCALMVLRILQPVGYASSFFDWKQRACTKDQYA
jgi:hypothetical protein